MEFALSRFIPTHPIVSESGKVESPLRSALDKQLKKMRIPKEKVEEFQRRLIEMYFNSQIPYGEPVGLLTSYSIASQTMQMTLNSFHAPGQKSNLSVSFSAFKELINGSRNPKNGTMTIYLNPQEMDVKSPEKVIKFGYRHLEYHELQYFLIGVSVRSLKNELPPAWYNYSNLRLKCYKERKKFEEKPKIERAMELAKNPQIRERINKLLSNA
jgi:RNA polymerase Rpb1, domain 5